MVQVGIVVTGGAVRLTGSGLGCPTFPRCTAESLVNTPELGGHGYIEFGNRLLTWVLTAVAVATLVSAWRARPCRRDLRVLAGVLVLGIVAQALVGGVSVLTRLNPWVVMGHFLLSSVLIGVAVLLVRRANPPDEPARQLSRWLRGLAVGVLAVAGATVVVGTIVTGSGPHAGDRSAPRTGLDLAAVTQLHADLVMLLVGLTVGLWVAAHAAGAPRRTTRAAATLLAVELAQGVVGAVQYSAGVPAPLVALHMLGAALLVAAAVDAALSTVAIRLPRRTPADHGLLAMVGRS